jgi:hypothetical protein
MKCVPLSLYQRAERVNEFETHEFETPCGPSRSHKRDAPVTRLGLASVTTRGRYTCIARKSLCWNCIIADLCEYKAKTPAPAAP